MGVVIFMQYGIMQIMHYLACAAGGIVYCVIKVLAAVPRPKKKEWGRGVWSFELQVSLWLADLIGISWGDKSGRHSKNHGSLAGGISRGFAARGGSAANSHSTGTAAPPPNLPRLVHNTASYAGYALLDNFAFTLS